MRTFRRGAACRAVAPLLLLFAATVAPAATVTVDRWLVSGPVPAAAPLFGADGDPALPAPLLATLRPAPGDSGWTVRDARRGRLDLGRTDAARAVTAVAYLDLDRDAAVRLALAGSGRAVLSLDGEEVVTLAGDAKEAEGTVDRPRGRYRLVLRAAVPADRRLRWRVTAAADSARVTAGLDAAVWPTRFDDRRWLEDVTALSLAPAGDRLLVLRSRRDADGKTHRRLELWDTAAGRRLATLAVGRVSTPGWLPGGRACRWRQDGALQVLDLESGECRRLLAGVKGAARPAWSPDGRYLYYLVSPPAPEPGDPRRLTALRQRLTDWNDRVTLRRRDTVTGVDRALTAAGDWQVMEYALSPDGSRLAVVRKVPHPGRPFFRSEIWVGDADGTAWRQVRALETGFEIWPSDLAWSPDGTRLAFVGPCAETGAGRPDHNWSAADVWVLDPATGELRDVSAGLDLAPPILQRGHLAWAGPDTLVFPADRGRGGVVAVLPLSDPAAVRLLDLGGTVGLFSPSADGRRAAWLHATPGRPPQVAMGFLEPGAVLRLNCPAAPDMELVTPVPAPVTRDDGTVVDGWLYLPGHPAGERLPLVVYYYGGAVSTLAGFNFTHQWLAANGYAVYVCNPRGAHSYGRTFADAHVGDWGEKAADDILAGVRAVLADHPELDPARVGCYGGSYGGFMTLTLLTRSDLFAAAVSMYGISDIASYWGGGIWGYTYGDMALGGAYPWTDSHLFAGRSPLYHADRVRAPLLLLHGRADVNVPELESEQMFTALRVLDRNVELVTFAGEDHGISGTWRNRVLHRTLLLEWFDRWLKGQPRAWHRRWAEQEGAA